MTNDDPILCRIDGPLVMIGYGSIGRGALPLIRRHVAFDPAALTIVEPEPGTAAALRAEGIAVREEALTPGNHRRILAELFPDGRGVCLNLSVDTGSLDLMRACRDLGVLYLDTSIEPWAGFIFGTDDNAARTSYAMRQDVRDEAARNPGGPTAVTCSGANPGMVNWLVKEALLVLARDLGRPAAAPATREGWARLMRDLGVRGIQIAERDTQARRKPRPLGQFVNTWSIEGFVAEAMQPAELGWGTGEAWFPPDGHRFDSGCRAGIWLERPGATTHVYSWCPTPGPQLAMMITHNEAISISDYFTLGPPEAPEYRPTCLFAYHPCDDAMASIREMLAQGTVQEDHHLLSADEIHNGRDELGVLLYGHERNALWYGSRLTNAEAVHLAPEQNATGLQVTSAALAGLVWAVENPRAGIVETDEMDHARCLDIQRPYLGSVEAHYTDWTPLSDRWNQFPEDTDDSDPWAFRNMLAG